MRARDRRGSHKRFNDGRVHGGWRDGSVPRLRTVS